MPQISLSKAKPNYGYIKMPLLTVDLKPSFQMTSYPIKSDRCFDSKLDKCITSNDVDIRQSITRFISDDIVS